MRKILFILFCCTAVFLSPSIAQKALPHITVKNINGKVIVSWLNSYRRLPKIINIQRSEDSLKDYTTIGSVLNPENIDNGYADSKPPFKNMYYRVFIAFNGGAYAFSEIKRPGKDLSLTALTTGDSIALSVLKPINNPHNGAVYVGRDNNVIIELADAEIKKYSIKFFDEGEKPVIELNKLPENFLTLEKVNFLHAGWFYYEIYDKGKLVEKNRFYLPKDESAQPASNNERDRKNK